MRIFSAGEVALLQRPARFRSGEEWDVFADVAVRCSFSGDLPPCLNLCFVVTAATSRCRDATLVTLLYLE